MVAPVAEVAPTVIFVEPTPIEPTPVVEPDIEAATEEIVTEPIKLF